MKTLPETILERSRLLPEGGVLMPKEFLNLGSRAAVDQAFSRLAKAGQLMRVSRGLYVAPITSRFGKRAPATEKVVSSLASKTHEVIAVSGARAANALGLTQQVPAREVFLTTGRSRTLQLGNAKVQIKHAPRWMLALGTTSAGEAVRALAWLGQEHACEATAKLHKHLPYSEWQLLDSVRAQLPSWMARAIGREATCA
ncbi:DUF6088 family protein [Pseudomonas sp. GCM10022186]|uniref:DUF6088 family protein n=1 Tax=Pseudomonas sp. GCM10022186 TaxID=3252650 RepID=UPI003617348C